jgi:hypothetical protein
MKTEKLAKYIQISSGNPNSTLGLIELDGGFELHLATEEHVERELRSVNGFINMKERNNLPIDEDVLRKREILINQQRSFG